VGGTDGEGKERGRGEEIKRTRERRRGELREVGVGWGRGGVEKEMEEAKGWVRKGGAWDGREEGEERHKGRK